MWVSRSDGLVGHTSASGRRNGSTYIYVRRYLCTVVPRRDRDGVEAVIGHSLLSTGPGHLLATFDRNEEVLRTAALQLDLAGRLAKLDAP